MPSGTEAFAILLVLLPGFVSAKIVDACCARTKRGDLERIVEALIFAFFIYIPYALIFHGQLPLEWTHGDRGNFTVQIRPGHLALLGACAIVLALFWSWMVAQDSMHSLLRRLHLTQRTSRISVWSDIFHQLGGTVEVTLGDGRTVIGWLKCYSDDAEESTLFVENAHWVGENSVLVPIDGPGILLTKECKIQFIQFRK